MVVKLTVGCLLPVFCLAGCAKTTRNQGNDDSGGTTSSGETGGSGGTSGAAGEANEASSVSATADSSGGTTSTTSGGPGDSSTSSSGGDGNADCTEGALRCIDFASRTRQRCVSGAWETAAGCAADERCDTASNTDGECKPVLSSCADRAPGESFCDGSVRVTCGPDLVSSTEVECESSSHCLWGEGEECAFCLPNEHACEGATLLGCNEERSAFSTLQQCENAGLCNAEAGACTTAACLAGQHRCDGDNIQACNADHTAFETTEACLSGLCDSVDLECDVCKANVTSCEDTQTISHCNSDGQSATSEPCIAPTPFCRGSGVCVECLGNADCDVLDVCRDDTCLYAVHDFGKEAAYAGEGLFDVGQTYFLPLPPLEHDAMLVSFNIDGISRVQTPYFVGYFALYASHPVDPVPFGDVIVRGDNFSFASQAKAPVEPTLLKAGELYWVAVDIGADTSGRVSVVWPTATTQALGAAARPYNAVSNMYIDLASGPTAIALDTLLNFTKGVPTGIFPSIYVVVQDVE